MCGIAGLFDTGRAPSADVLENMNAYQAHRGPDDGRIYREGPIGFAHRRLSIIDLETGQQPLFNEDESVVLVCNGEIYNHRKLRESLIDTGHTFRSKSDNEVLVHLYEEEGPTFVKHLEGMFAFALWDGVEERLLLARDPIGIKPIVLLRDANSVAFASELPALLQTELDQGGLDRTAMSLYFALGHIPAPFTAFENVTKLLPGEYAIIESDGITRERFYFPLIETQSPRFGDAARALRVRFEESVRKRLMSDVPLGAFLSGGIDSSIVVGTMATQMDEPVQTFTIGFQHDQFDESWAARKVADFHDTDHHEVKVSADEVRAVLPDVLERLGEPFAGLSLLPSYILARETANDVKVALSGDGGDELFAGYDKYLAEYYSRYYRALPRFFRRNTVERLINWIPASRGSRLGSLAYKGQWFVNRSAPSEVPARHFELMRIPPKSKAIFTDVDPFAVGRRALYDQHSMLDLSVRNRDALARIQTVDTRYSVPNQILRKVDLASMYNSLEVRVPFLSTDVVKYALSLPTEQKITPLTRKRVLKRAFDDVLPRSIIDRKKAGFDMPIGEWFKGELANEFRQAVREVGLGLLDTDEVLEIFEEHTNGRRDHDKFLWTVFVFKRWAKRMIRLGILDEQDIRTSRTE